MSSQVNLMLRPPPNVDFVHGYPGIPPMAPDRPQACVKGEVEVRVGQHGVKAKWVRIELRKVETLPGGGGQAVFYDFVGPSPITLWSAGDEEYQTLHGANYPFSIRIPESIPPTIALENRAGIKYELVASVCVKGKRKMLRSAKAQVVTYIAPIIIDKHELHSTWPVYCQPDSRQVESNGITLHIERNHTCYGPGDRVSVSAIVKSQSMHTIIVRAFEFSLHELTVFRGSAGTMVQGKRGGQPQTKSVIVDESKIPVNATLYGGTQHRAELALNISPRHTTTTLNAARHIDITYTLRVTALLASGEPLRVELPVIISNWQRQVSEEAIKRIGPAPSLSLTQPMPVPTSPTEMPHSHTIGGRPSSGVYNYPPPHPPSGKFSTMPNGHPGSTLASSSPYDEFGYNKGATMANAPTKAPAEEMLRTNSTTTGMSTVTPTRTSVFQVDEVSGRPAQSKRPVSARSTDNPATKFTVVNAGVQQWMSAEEEKAKLYASARDKVDKVQGVAPKPMSSSPSATATTTSANKNRPTTASSTNPGWMSAEEEKTKLYNDAKATADRTQAFASASSEKTRLYNEARATAERTQAYASASSGTGAPLSAAAAMYQSAMAARSTNAPPPVSTKTQQTTTTPTKSSSSMSGIKSYLSAEEEKAQLRRYQEAKQTAERTQSMAFSNASSPSHSQPHTAPTTPNTAAGSSMNATPAMQHAGSPIPYDSLFSSSSSSPAQPGGAGGPSDMPPSFAGSSSGGGFDPNLSEKERVKRAYAAQDAASSAGPAPPPLSQEVPAYSPPVSPAPKPARAPIIGKDILSEKERLRRKYAEEDAAAEAGAGAAQSQSQGGSSMGMGVIPPYSPPPPSMHMGSSSRPLSAEEEKARLKVQYAAQDHGGLIVTNGIAQQQQQQQQHYPMYMASTPSPPVPSPPPPTSSPPPPTMTNGHLHASPSVRSMGPGPSSPPPLMPRPPAEYIQETKEEDARVARYVSSDGVPIGMDMDAGYDHHDYQQQQQYLYQHANGNGNASASLYRRMSVPPPPLPPKPLSS